MPIPALNVISQKNLLSLMINEKLFSKAALGRYYGLSRERVRKILECNEVDFDNLKEKAVKEVYQKNIDLKGEEWKKIVHLNTAHDYFVSNKGRIARDIKRRVSGVEFTERKVLSNSTYKNKHYKVSLALLTKNEDETYSEVQYVHLLVANTFNIKSKPKDKRSPRIRFKDNDIHNVTPENLKWV